MSSLRPLALGLTLLVFGVTGANAEGLGDRGSMRDEPYARPFSWTGFYIGAHLGGARGTQTVTSVEDFGADVTTSNDPNGNIFGGLQGGYNWQYGNVVLGVEANFGQMLLSHQARGRINAVEQGDGLYGSLTGRLGYAFGRSLIYAKGGFAFFDGEATVQTPPGEGGVIASTTNTFAGWTIGGGLEYALTPTWSLTAEYQRFNFGDEQSSVNLVFAEQLFHFNHTLSVDTVKFGINYRW